MAYIGTQPLAGQYRKLDDISSGFNGATTSFTTSVGGTNVTAGSPQQLLVSLGGVIQQPTVDYTVNTSTITFTTAPASGLSFFAVLMGDALNTSVPADGSITSAKLAGSLSVGLAAGSASTPSLFFTGDTNTGIYSPGADQVAISTNGSGRLFVDSSGRVGIGTSTVDYAVDVRGTNPRIQIKQSSASDLSLFQTVDNAGNAFYIGADNSTGSNFALGNYARLIYSQGTAPLRISTNGTHAVTIDSSQRVGIGTTNPATPLHVNSGAISTGARLESSSAGAYLNFANSSGNGVYIGANTSAFYVETNGSERARIDSSGRLLVGTSSARSNMFGGSVGPATQVEGSSANGSISSIISSRSDNGGAFLALAHQRSGTVGGNTVLQSGDYFGGLSFQGSDGTNFLVGAEIAAFVDGTPGTNDMPGRLVFSTTADGASSPTERMRIASDGFTNVFANGAGFQARISAAPGTTTAIFGGKYGASSTTTGTDSFLVWSNGNVVNTNNSYGAISDLKLKENIIDAGSQWNDLKALQIRKYNFKEGQTHTQIGLVAQEVELVSPGLVTESPDRDAEGNDLGTVTKSVNYSVLYMKAVKALQEAMERIETLEAKVAALEAA